MLGPDVRVTTGWRLNLHLQRILFAVVDIHSGEHSYLPFKVDGEAAIQFGGAT